MKFQHGAATATAVVAALLSAAAGRPGMQPQAPTSSPSVQPMVAPAQSAHDPKPVAPMKPLRKGATGNDIQRALADYTARTGQTYVVNSAAFAPGAKPKRLAADVPPDVPDSFTYLNQIECRSSNEGNMDLDNGYIGKINNHWQWCGWQYLQPKLQDPFTKQVLASIDFRLTILAWGSNADSMLHFDMYVDEVMNPEGGMTAQNTVISFAPVCEPHEAAVSCDLPPGPGGILASLDGAAPKHFDMPVNLPAYSPENPDRLATLDAGIEIVATTSAGPGQVASEHAAAVVRCDGATGEDRGGFTTNACIFGGVQARYQLDASDASVSEVAQHLYWAINDPNSTTPLPAPGDTKDIPNKLTRLVDPVRQDKNRDVSTGACDRLLQNPRPPNKDCDEYPFATSYQGAATAPTTDYSVALVDSTQNQSEGGRRGNWYIADRYVDGDEFLVDPICSFC